MPTNRCWVKNDLGALQRREPSRLGIPLIPADEYPDFGVLRLPGAKARVARRELEFLVVQRIVGDVRLTVDAEQRTVGVDDDGGIVI